MVAILHLRPALAGDIPILAKFIAQSVRVLSGFVGVAAIGVRLPGELILPTRAAALRAA